MSTISARATGASARSPPASGTRYSAAAASNPSRNRSIQGRPLPLDRARACGRPSERNAARGCAPIAARSLKPLTSVRCPTDSGGCQSSRKWRPSIERSVVTASSSPAPGRNSAQSSPIPSRTVPADSASSPCRIQLAPGSSATAPAPLPRPAAARPNPIFREAKYDLFLTSSNAPFLQHILHGRTRIWLASPKCQAIRLAFRGNCAYSALQ